MKRSVILAVSLIGVAILAALIWRFVLSDAARHVPSPAKIKQSRSRYETNESADQPDAPAAEPGRKK